MRTLRQRLEAERKRTGLLWEVIERDYVLSWVLAGLAQVEALRKNLVFKGGTALKKCYFGNYRFSQDLDFSALEEAPRGDALEAAINEACGRGTELAQAVSPLTLTSERYTEREPHPTGQEAFIIRAELPWHRQPLIRAGIEITVDEPVLTKPKRKHIIHRYGEPMTAHIQVYSLEEIVAEKLRTILQGQRTQARGRWTRPRARDYYDLWQILTRYGRRLKRGQIPELFRAKCEVRSIEFRGVDDWFQPESVQRICATWAEWLEPLVPNLRPCEEAVTELRRRLTRVFKQA